MEELILEKLKTKYIGRNIIYFDEIDSTQKEAKRRIKNQNIQNGSIFIAKMQTDGIGTHNRKWYTEKGANITFTLVLYPNCNINKLKNLTIIIAECIVKSINNLYNINLEIKYPNDVVYNGKKLAGILTESITQKEIVKELIIGIGINVNQNKFEEDVKDIAISLKNILKKDLKKEEIISEFLNIFEEKYEALI